MTSPVISVKNATTEYSGVYSCTVRNRVGSDQCELRLDVVPRKYLLSVYGNSLFPLSLCSPLWFSQQGYNEGTWMLIVNKALYGLVISFPKSQKEKLYFMNETFITVAPLRR